MSQWVEIRHLYLVEGVAKKRIARRLQLDIKTVRRALEQPRPPVRVSSPRVRFLTAAELVTLLVEAQQQGHLARKLDQLARFDVVILDELGYVPFDKTGADLLFGFISQRYERRSLVVTTNLPFARWAEVFLDATAAAAVIDRIVHHATVLTTAGDSYRLKAATRNHASRVPQEVPPQ